MNDKQPVMSKRKTEPAMPPGTDAVFEITCRDVLTRGGGPGSQNHCGNKTYRMLVNLNKVRTLHVFVCFSCLDPTG